MIGNTTPVYLLAENSPSDWKEYANFMCDSRINMNVRQVRVHATAG